MRNKVKIIGIVMCVLGWSNLLAQEADYFLGKRKYPFIKYDSNHFEFPGNSSSFDHMYATYDQIMIEGKGKLRIIHIGGSHIQADIYTHLMRQRMQTNQMGMNGGRGFIFPYRMAKTNNPRNYKVSYTGNWQYCKNTQSKKSCSLGLSGISVYTSDKWASFEISLKKDTILSYTFNKVRIFHESEGYELVLETADSAFRPVTYDSLGYSLFILDRETNLFTLQITDTSELDNRFVLQGISLDIDDSGIVYNSIGVNGSKLESYLNCTLYENHMKALEPDLVIFSIGTNDAYTRNFNTDKYRSEYIRLIERTLSAAPNTAILLTVPNDSYLYKKYINKNTREMQQVILELAEKYDCGVWDFYTVMGGLNSAQTWYNYHLMQYDRIHFNKQGYLLKGELFHSAFLKGWEAGIESRKDARAARPKSLNQLTINPEQKLHE